MKTKGRQNFNRNLFLLCCIFSLILGLTGCGKSISADELSNTRIDYNCAEAFEDALNSGDRDVEGKVVEFVVKEYHPDSGLGVNCWAGEHLNFVSDSQLDVKAGDAVVGRVKKVSKVLGSWKIKYEEISIIDSSLVENVPYKAENSEGKLPENSTPQTSLEEEFKNSCVQIDYKTLARNPDAHIGDNFVFHGKVLQAMEYETLFSGRTVELRIAVTEDEYGFWDDVVYSSLSLEEGQDRILDDDMITIWGTCRGLKTYIGVLGSAISVPEISIEYYKIELPE